MRRRLIFSILFAALGVAPGAVRADGADGPASAGASPRPGADVVQRQKQRLDLERQLERINAEIDALKREKRGFGDDYRLRARMADARPCPAADRMTRKWKHQHADPGQTTPYGRAPGRQPSDIAPTWRQGRHSLRSIPSLTSQPRAVLRVADLRRRQELPAARATGAGSVLAAEQAKRAGPTRRDGRPAGTRRRRRGTSIRGPPRAHPRRTTPTASRVDSGRRDRGSAAGTGARARGGTERAHHRRLDPGPDALAHPGAVRGRRLGGSPVSRSPRCHDAGRDPKAGGSRLPRRDAARDGTGPVGSARPRDAAGSERQRAPQARRTRSLGVRKPVRRSWSREVRRCPEVHCRPMRRTRPAFRRCSIVKRAALAVAAAPAPKTTIAR